MRFPVKIRFGRKCPRCGLRYPVEDASCPHCTGLIDSQVLKIKARHRQQLAGNENLGRLLLYIAGLIVVALVIFSLNRN